MFAEQADSEAARSDFRRWWAEQARCPLLRTTRRRRQKGHWRAHQKVPDSGRIEGRKDVVFMKINFRRCAGTVAIAMGIGISGLNSLQANAAPFFEDQDYSKNKTYQQGMREGKNDGAHHKDHSKKRHFNKDEDQRAYEAGYQKGHGN